MANENSTTTPRERYLARLDAELRTEFQNFIARASIADKQFLTRILNDFTSGCGDEDLGLITAFMNSINGGAN